jgi:flavodoxin
MHIGIIHESYSGTTKQAAKHMGERLIGLGHTCDVLGTYEIQSTELTRYDFLFLGCWTHGLFIIGQHPTKDWKAYIQSIPSLEGKSCAVFTTYKLATGPMLRKMTRIVESRQGKVVAAFKYRGAEPTAAFDAFAQTLND